MALRNLADVRMSIQSIRNAVDLIDSAIQNLDDNGRLAFAALIPYYGNANLVLATPDGTQFAKGLAAFRALVAADLPVAVALLNRDPQTFTGTNKFQRIATAQVAVTIVNGANQNVPLPTAGLVILSGMTGAWSLGGIVAPATPGLELDLFNNTLQAGAINQLDAGSAAANQFVCPGGVNLAVPANGLVTVKYATAAWLVKSHN